MPTKTEQADLFQALYGRNGEAPMVVIAASSPADCFNSAYEACKIALEYMTPVILLTDGYIANGSEPWLIPNVSDLPDIDNRLTTDSENFSPYNHGNEKLARPWAIPGTPGLEHRIGGLEKWDDSGHVSYDPDNHDYMVRLRQRKIEAVTQSIPDAEVYGDDSGEVLVIGWGGPYGAIRSAVKKMRANGKSVSHLHLRHLNPFPKNLGEILLKYNKVLVPELNLGQLASVLRSKFLIDIESFNKIAGKPFITSEIMSKIEELL